MGGVGLLETPLGVLRSFCFTIAKRGFWLGDRMESVGKAPVCAETPLRISAVLGKVLAAGVLSCVSGETWCFEAYLGGFCSLGVVLRGVTGSWNTWIRIGPENKVKLSTCSKHGFWFRGHPQVLVSDENQA